VSISENITLKCWEIIADNLKKRGWSLRRVSAVDCEGRTIWIADAHCDGKRFVVRTDEMLTVFVELERAIHEFAVTVSQESVFNDCKAGFGNGEVRRI
jgi:SH3-like domain-containing protein